MTFVVRLLPCKYCVSVTYDFTLHRARETVELLKAETPDFIPPARWAPNSPDLSPVDYTIWSVMHEKV